MAVIPVIFFLVFVLGILGSVFWIWMLVDCVTKEPSNDENKIVWVLIIALTNGIGALLYFFVRRPKRIEQYGE